MRLVVFHYHDRPGGVRQVISRGLPQLVDRLDGVTEVVLLLGEFTDPAWVREVEASLAGRPLRVAMHRDLGYLSGRPQEIGAEARALVLKELSGSGALLWAHNLSVGRNLPLLLNLPEWCAEAGAGLWLHHHDWWWDGRWARWADWVAGGIAGLEEALELSVPVGSHIRHWCVNLADLCWLQTRARKAAQWVGNPLPDMAVPGENAIAQARAWLHSLTEGRPVWLAPVRALRRKNLAEAIFLAQQQTRPACIVTTGGPSSPAEVPAWDFLCQAALKHRLPFIPAVLSTASRTGSLSRQVGLTTLLAAADAIVMPSLQEGFGLPYLEAAALGKPLLARALPEVTANLAALGCTLPGAYGNLPVARDAFDRDRESSRLAERAAVLRSGLPHELVMNPESLEAAGDPDFGSLTLEAQVEVLQSNARCSIPLPQPQVPAWPPASRLDGWAERFFQERSGEGQHSIEPLGQDVRPPPQSLLPEVIRRFHDWQRHPLLWP